MCFSVIPAFCAVDSLLMATTTTFVPLDDATLAYTLLLSTAEVVAPTEVSPKVAPLPS